MAHNRETHFSNVNELCRICGNLALTRQEKRRSVKKNYCSRYSFEINSLFDIDVTNEMDKFSKFVCRKCVSNMKIIISRKSEKALASAREKNNLASSIWVDFVKTTGHCPLCDKYYRLRPYIRRNQNLDNQPSSPPTNSDVSDVVLSTPMPPAQT